MADFDSGHYTPNPSRAELTMPRVEKDASIKQRELTGKRTEDEIRHRIESLSVARTCPPAESGSLILSLPVSMYLHCQNPAGPHSLGARATRSRAGRIRRHVAIEEVPGHEGESHAEVGHEGEVLLADNVLLADPDPRNEVFVHEVLPVGEERVQVLGARPAHVLEPVVLRVGRVHPILAVVIPRDSQMVLGERHGSDERVGVRQDLGRGPGREGYRVAPPVARCGCSGAVGHSPVTRLPWICHECGAADALFLNVPPLQVLRKQLVTVPRRGFNLHRSHLRGLKRVRPHSSDVDVRLPRDSVAVHRASQVWTDNGREVHLPRVERWLEIPRLDVTSEAGMDLDLAILA
mmetsp:Transcript_47832/g.136818  ORF Transcript_47832/g.136818 Transcript_47832/m.136818 type:complete len:349 (-) Transcript_47832:664-1710(-)